MGKTDLRDDIKDLFEQTITSFTIDDVRSIITKRGSNLGGSFQDFVSLDSKIPWKGVHNINKFDAKGVGTGDFAIKDRPIFRPIQYVESHFLDQNFDMLTRVIVERSSLHVEASLKRYCRRTDIPVGPLLNSREGKTLPRELWKKLDVFRELLWNQGKHETPLDREHLFSETEAIAAYFICRKLGSELLDLIHIKGLI